MRNCFFILWLTFIYSVSVVFAQRQEIDSLQKLLKNYAERDTNYINTLNELADQYYGINPDSILFFAEKALTLAEKIRYQKGQTDAIINKGRFFFLKGEYPQALQLCLEALRIAEKINYQKGIGSIYNNIANTYAYQGKYPEALENHLKAVRIGEKMGDKKRIAASSLNMAVVYQYQKKYEKALDYYFKSLKISQEIDYKEVASYNLMGIADTYTEQGNYKQALDYYFKSLAILQEIAYTYPFIGVNRGLAAAYLGLKEYATALKYAQEGLDLTQKLGDKTYARDLHEITARIYEAKGNTDMALFHYKQFKSHADSLNNLERDKKTANLQAQYEFDKKTALMQAEQAKKDRQQERQRNQLYWIIISSFIGLVSAVVILLLIFRSRKKIKFAYDKLAVSTLKIQQAKEETEAQAEELQKLNHFKDRLFSIIAHDLRGPMAALQGTISILDPDILNKSDLLTIKAELSKRFETTDKILHDLLQWTKDQMQGETTNPKLLNLNEIVSEKINLFGSIAQNKDIRLSNELMPDSRVFADENHVNIILQNLLSNALKFTYAGGTVRINSEAKGEMLQISVEDTGKGMDEEEQNRLFSARHFTTKGTAGEKGNGLGLHLVKDLTEKNGGKIWVTSQEDKGSEFCFLLPVHPNL